MFLFKDLQDEVKRRATKDRGGTSFDTAVKNAINFSLFRLSREAPWRIMRRKAVIDTIAPYSEGSGAGAFTEDSTSITVTGATFLTDSVEVGRIITLSGTTTKFKVENITGETTITLNEAYDGTTTTTGTYEILGQVEYNLPIQSGHRMFMWHREWGTPSKLEYIPDQDFYGTGQDDLSTGIPTHYRMWGADMVSEQLREASVLRITSSDSDDTNIGITVFGTVSGYPDYEVITTNSGNGTTAVSGSKSFTSVERVVKNGSTEGRITVDANSANTTVAVLPVGDTTGGIVYRKIQLWQIPTSAFEVNVQYYKDPYRLVNDGDVHELGQEFDEAIILLSTSKLKYEQDQNEGDKFFALTLK